MRKDLKLTVMLQCKDELKNGNLPRFMDSISRYADALVCYDDASTDGSYEYLLNWDKAWSGRQLKDIHLIRSDKNDYANEVAHKAQMLEKCLEIESSWIFRIDADEVLEKDGEDRIRKLCEYPASKGGHIMKLGGDEWNIDSFAFRNANLWRHPSFYRLDSQFNDFVSCRLWKNNGNLSYKEIKRGLHQRAVPDGLVKEDWAPFITLHYGFASAESILHKYHMYKAHGQDGWALHRLVDERTLTLARSNPSWFREPLEQLPLSQVTNRPLVSML